MKAEKPAPNPDDIDLHPRGRFRGRVVRRSRLLNNSAQPLDHPRPGAPRQDDQGFGPVTPQKEHIRIAHPALEHGESFAAFPRLDLANERCCVGSESVDIDIGPIARYRLAPLSGARSA
jgi:hypothetical protein